MKKLLLSLGAMALGLSAFAGEATFNFTTNSYGLPEYNAEDTDKTPYAPKDAVITDEDVKITLSYTPTLDNNGNETTDGGWRMWKDGLREYNKRNPTFTVTTTNGENVVSVKWAVKSSVVKFAVQGTQDEITEWTGDQESVTFESLSTGNGAIVTITVGYGDYEVSEPEPEPETPEFTVADALEYIAAGNSGTAIVSGVVSEVEFYNGTYGSITYYIKDTLDDTDALKIYGGLGLEGAKFNALTDVVVGAKVQVRGTLTLYNNTTPEMDSNNILLSYQLPDDYEEPATPEGQLTVTEAVNDWLLEGYSGLAVVKGLITEIQEISTQYGNATYTIKDSEDAEVSLVVYRGYFLDGEKFTEGNEIEVGGSVVVEGTLQLYGADKTPEITASKIINYYAPGESGVASIGQDANAPAVYYNLQGVRVANPAQGGLYIIRQGDKTFKAVVR